MSDRRARKGLHGEGPGVLGKSDTPAEDSLVGCAENLEDASAVRRDGLNGVLSGKAAHAGADDYVTKIRHVPRRPFSLIGCLGRSHSTLVNEQLIGTSLGRTEGDVGADDRRRH